MSEDILNIKNLRVVYHSDLGLVKAVDNVSFKVTKGEIVALVGESGSGKSTLGLTIIKLLPPSARILSGMVLFKGIDLLKLSENEMRKLRGNRITMVFQEPNVALNPSFRILDFLYDTIVTHRGKISRDEVIKYSIELLKIVRIPSPESVIKRYPHELSGGMKQRVLIAAAIANKPDLLIADEPTSALDVSIQAQIIELFESLKNEIGMAIIFITHNMGVAAQIADRIAIMYAGKILEIGKTSQIFEKPLHPYTKGLLKAVPKISSEGKRAVLEPIPGSIPDLVNPPPGCRFHPRCPYVMDICRKEEPPMIYVEENHCVVCWLYNKR